MNLLRKGIEVGLKGWFCDIPHTPFNGLHKPQLVGLWHHIATLASVSVSQGCLTCGSLRRRPELFALNFMAVRAKHCKKGMGHTAPR